MFSDFWDRIVEMWKWSVDLWLLPIKLLKNVLGMITWLFEEIFILLFDIINFVGQFIVVMIHQDWSNETPPMDGFEEIGVGMDALSGILKNLDLGLWNSNAFLKEGVYWFTHNLDSIAMMSEEKPNPNGLFGIVQSLQQQMSGIDPLIGTFPETAYPMGINISMFIGHYRYVVGDMLYQLTVMSIIFFVCWGFLDLFIRLTNMIKRIIRMFF